ncbi:MAG: mevalonate kinase [Polyangiaceae bacterium]|nr:mevalonate kinase [Polyangiaceae bacterium]
MGGERQRGEGRASGKLILLGEHAVVYGVPALAVGISRGLEARAWRVAARAERSAAPDARPGLDVIGRHTSEDATLAAAYAALLAAGEPVAGDDLAVRVHGDLTPGVGLGFSAAAAVAIARAVESLVHGGAAVPAVQARAMAWERVFHGNPSGVDTAAALLGGCIRYTRAEGPRPFDPPACFELCVGFTGTAASTAAMVARVAELRNAEPARFEAELAEVGGLVAQAIAALERSELARLGALLDRNQGLLAGWGVSTDAIDVLCRTARAAGALGAKLSGSGGGGVVVALVGPGGDDGRAATRVLEAWRRLGFGGFRTAVGAGVAEAKE